MFRVPDCFRFCPTERELVDLFLIPKARGLALPDGHQVLDRFLYGDAPWNVFKDDDPWVWPDGTMKKRILCVFSRVIAMTGQSKKRKVRTAGCGRWVKTTVDKSISGSEGNVIGNKSVFKFKLKKEVENETRGKWIMHEYFLANKKAYKDNGIVVCKIKNYVDSEAASDSVEKTSKRKGNKRVRKGGVSTDQMGNQECEPVIELNTFGPSDNVSGDLQLNNQEIVAQQNENQEVVPRSTATAQDPHSSGTSKGSNTLGQSVNVSGDLQLSNQVIVAQQYENQEVGPRSTATAQDPHSSGTSKRSTPILHGFFK